jgi:YbgC/YbaW family acyl-CoA thioester hydrolase
MNKQPHSHYKIRFSDCDMFGHLNNARYLDYLINAREDHLKEAYEFDFMKYYKNDLAWVISSHEIVYARPAVYNEMVFIQSTLISVDDASLHIEMIMMNEKQDHVKAIMRSKLIPVNIKTGRRDQHQPEFMEWVTELVNDEVDEAQSLQERLKQVVTACKAKSN